MDREIFSDDVGIDAERRVRWLKQRIERLERAGCETTALAAELKKIEGLAATEPRRASGYRAA